jgi:hypothetical protein
MLELSPDDLEQHVAQLEEIVPDEETIRLTEVFMNTFDKKSWEILRRKYV